jgi:hypothetical protein
MTEYFRLKSKGGHRNEEVDIGDDCRSSNKRYLDSFGTVLRAVWMLKGFCWQLLDLYRLPRLLPSDGF